MRLCERAKGGGEERTNENDRRNEVTSSRQSRALTCLNVNFAVTQRVCFLLLRALITGGGAVLIIGGDR